MFRWKSRAAVFVVCFVIGLVAVLVCAAVINHFVSKHRGLEAQQAQIGCLAENYFNQPEEVLSALKSDEVSMRREMFRRLFLSPTIKTVYYDYERDLNYPERVDRARLEYVQLDEGSELEAILTFVRFEHPVALIFKKESCGWRLVAALSSWLRFDDYPYDTWLSLPETIFSGVHELLIRESTGDSTSYLRKARLMKLINGSLEQVAEIAEETVNPVDDYRNQDWSDVRRRQASRYTFAQAKNAQPARIEIETVDEVVKYQGTMQPYTYWLETDGAWHALRKNWSERPFDRIKFLGRRQEHLVWDEQRRRFVNEER